MTILVQPPNSFCNTISKKRNGETSMVVHQRRGKRPFYRVLDLSTLPQAVLEEILKRMPLLDQLSFGWVCKWWRHSLLDSRQLHRFGVPWLMLCANSQANSRDCCSVLENKIWEIYMPEVRGHYLWGAFQDWLITVKQGPKKFYIWISLFNPFTRVGIHLPLVVDMHCKAVLSSSPMEDDCVVMLIHNLEPCLSYWTMGSQKWAVLTLDLCIQGFCDGIFFNGYFYLLTSTCDIVAIKASSLIASDQDSTSEIKPHVYKVGIPPLKERVLFSNRYYLVESCGEILLVCRVFKSERGLHTFAFEVFKLDFCKTAWIKLESLGDRILFLNHCGSRCFTAKELGVNMSNCICFTNDGRMALSGFWGRVCERVSDFGAWGVYNLSDDCFETSFRGRPRFWNCLWITVPLWWYNLKNKISPAGRGQSHVSILHK